MDLFELDTMAALLENQRQRVHMSRELLAAHHQRDFDGVRVAQAKLTKLNGEAVEIQCAGLRRAQGVA